jgi:hypothetical protein
MRKAPRVWFLLAALALPERTFAQGFDSVFNQPPRKWDAGGGLGIPFGLSDDPIVPLGEWSAEVNRYWTAHLKTSFALSTTGNTFYQYSGGQQSFRETRRTANPPGVSGTVGYQFYENVFVHPYVLAGLRFTSVSETTRTASAVYPYQLLSMQSRQRVLEVRPIIGAGCKSYFGNGRAFVRSELLMAFGLDGPPRAVVRVGAGVDF